MAQSACNKLAAGCVRDEFYFSQARTLIELCRLVNLPETAAPQLAICRCIRIPRMAIRTAPCAVAAIAARTARHLDWPQQLVFKTVDCCTPVARACAASVRSKCTDIRASCVPTSTIRLDYDGERMTRCEHHDTHRERDGRCTVSSWSLIKSGHSARGFSLPCLQARPVCDGRCARLPRR